MGKYLYNAEPIAKAIIISNNLNNDILGIKNEAINKLNGLTIPEGLNISDLIENIKTQINNLNTRTEEIYSDIISIKNKIENADSSLSSKINFLLSNYSITSFGLNNNIITFSELPINITQYTEEELIFIKENIHNILYNTGWKGEYGGNQGAPYYLFLNGDTRYINVIKKYYPNITEEEAVDMLYAMNAVGCQYVATANCILSAYADDPEQFEKDYGFPMVYKATDGNYYSNVNLLFADIYCNAYSSNEVNTNVLNYAADLISGSSSPKDYLDPVKTAYDGSSAKTRGLSNFDTKSLIENNYTNNKDIDITVAKHVLNFFDSSDINSHDETIQNALSNGVHVQIGARDFTLYSVDENGNRNQNIAPVEYKNAGHCMTIVDKNDNGDYIVSTWG